MLSANFKPKTTAAASRGFLATARLSCNFSHMIASGWQLFIFFLSNFVKYLNSCGVMYRVRSKFNMALWLPYAVMVSFSTADNPQRFLADRDLLFKFRIDRIYSFEGIVVGEGLKIWHLAMTRLSAVQPLT